MRTGTVLGRSTYQKRRNGTRRVPANGAHWLAEVHNMMYGWDATGTGGWSMIVGMAIVALAVLGSVWLIVRRPGSAGPSRSTAEEILRERFARGELSDDQFDEARKRLG